MTKVSGAGCAIFMVNFWLALFLAAACAAQDCSRLALLDANGRELFSRPMRPGAIFAVRYIHSVAKTPVTDYFRIQGHDIVLDRTEYSDFGAGLPHNPEEEQKMRVEHGRIIISGYNRVLPSLDLRVGRIARHTLLLFENPADAGAAEEIPLAGLAKPGSAISFRVLACDK